jgi:hypothetical protein
MLLGIAEHGEVNERASRCSIGADANARPRHVVSETVGRATYRSGGTYSDHSLAGRPATSRVSSSTTETSTRRARCSCVLTGSVHGRAYDSQPRGSHANRGEMVREPRIASMSPGFHRQSGARADDSWAIRRPSCSAPRGEQGTITRKPSATAMVRRELNLRFLWTTIFYGETTSEPDHRARRECACPRAICYLRIR